MIRAVMYSGNSFDHGNKMDKTWYKNASFHVSKSINHSYSSFVPRQHTQFEWVASRSSLDHRSPRMLTITVFFVTSVKYVTLPYPCV